MRIGLVSYRCENRNIAFNISQIELAMKRYEDKVDLLCFGEAFLQGFDSLCWNYQEDETIALELSSDIITHLQNLTIHHGISLATGYIEKNMGKLYSSYVVISNGKIIHNYRRISKGWKEYTKTDDNYCEGKETKSFHLCGKDMMIALCGDLWEYPDRFKTDSLLIWPIYVNYTVDQWNSGLLDEYVFQAFKASKDVLMINPIDNDPINHGASFYFQEGKIISRLPFDKEDVLLAEI